MYQEVNAEEVERLMEESAEAIAWHDEISRILGQSLTPEVNLSFEGFWC